jgi:hypothetical protein
MISGNAKQIIKKAICIGCITLAVIMIVLTAIAWDSRSSNLEAERIINNNIIVSATAVEIVEHSAVQDNGGAQGRKVVYGYRLRYYYVDDNGFEYWWTSDAVEYRLEKQAAAHLGETLEIYIDGKGQRCFPITMKADPESAYNTAILVSVLTAVYITLLVIAYIFITIVKRKNETRRTIVNG